MKNHPAFPGQVLEKVFVPKNGPAEPIYAYAPGLTKREYFAGLAMQGHLAAPNLVEWLQKYYDNSMSFPVAIARMSTDCADGLVAELEKTGKEEA